MGKRADSVIGIDLGKYVFKGVNLRRKSDSRLVLTGFASREVPENLLTVDGLAEQLKLLIKELGNGTKSCVVAISDPAALLRIIEQPETPIELLRNALRLNGMAVLNQECKDYVLDVAQIACSSPEHSAPAANPDGESGGTQVATQTKYLVGGIPRMLVKLVSEALAKLRLTAEIIQVAPVCSFNAFEFAYPEIFANEAFLLLDIGHSQSTVLVGSKGELVLARSIDYGGKALTHALTADGALEKSAAWTLVQQGDEGMTDICRISLSRLAMEVRNSIGFFEGQREESIGRIFVSGGMAHAEMVLQMLSDELGLACEVWDPLETCEVSIPSAKRQALPDEFVSLNIACGAAFEYLGN